MRRGSAIPVTLFALALISAMVLGVSFGTRQASSASLIASRGTSLEPEPERLLVQAIAAWDSSERLAQPLGSTDAVAAGGSTVWVTRLSPAIYWLVATASTADQPRLRRRLGVVITVDSGVPALVRERPWGELP